MYDSQSSVLLGYTEEGFCLQSSVVDRSFVKLS